MHVMRGWCSTGPNVLAPTHWPISVLAGARGLPASGIGSGAQGSDAQGSQRPGCTHPRRCLPCRPGSSFLSAAALPGQQERAYNRPCSRGRRSFTKTSVVYANFNLQFRQVELRDALSTWSFEPWDFMCPLEPDRLDTDYYDIVVCSMVSATPARALMSLSRTILAGGSVCGCGGRWVW